MTFEKHVKILRRSIFIDIVGFVMFSVVGYFLFPWVYDALVKYLQESLYTTQIQEAFLTRLKISLFTGLLLDVPLIATTIVSYAFPALLKKEKVVILIVSIAGLALFVTGIGFSLSFVIPVSLDFLKSEVFFPESLHRIISYGAYFKFFARLLVAFGIAFQFPIITILLMAFGVLKVATLQRYFKYFFAAIFLASAIITPPDIVSQILLSVPLVLLYAISIGIGKVFHLGAK